MLFSHARGYCKRGFSSGVLNHPVLSFNEKSTHLHKIQRVKLSLKVGQGKFCSSRIDWMKRTNMMDKNAEFKVFRLISR